MALACRVEEPSTASIADMAHLFDSLIGAWASTDGGMVTPSALVALRLMARWCLVGARTGRSPVFSPLRLLMLE